MSRTRRLSLRARMLVMLVGVTTALLLIMGTVSTYLLARRVDAQIASFNAHLEARSKQAPATFIGQGNGPAAVEIQLRANKLQVVSLSTGTLTSQLARSVTQLLGRPSFRALSQTVAAGQLGRAKQLLAAGGCAEYYLNCPPFGISSSVSAVTRWVPDTGPQGRAILFVAEPSGSDPDQVRGFIIAELITGTALIALLALGGEWLIGRGLEPLDDMTRTANDITSRGDLTARMPDADDQTEVGRLGSSINTMLDRIQQAFSSRLRSEQKVREFAADASHELRTPLTTIRGYAELYRQGALGPDQLPNAMRRIEQEAERMSTLVAELLELARLDRTSSLDLTETDLAGVVRDAVADAVAVEPQRPVRAEAPPRLVAVVDEPRIRQVLANLLGNVRAHTPVTTPVAVRLGEITGGVLIEVADAGPGMSTQDAIRAFNRFHRAADADRPTQEQAEVDGAAVPGRAKVSVPADGKGSVHNGNAQNGRGSGSYPRAEDRAPGSSGRAERTSGSGLGLSIVQAIANAHGGRATLDSWPSQGTKVRVWLPVRIVP